MLFQRILGPYAGQYKQLGRLEGSSGDGDFPFCHKVTSLSLPLPHQARFGAREDSCIGLTIQLEDRNPLYVELTDSNKCLCQPRSEILDLGD